ncbi:MAG: hypothetical protein Q8N88_03120 [Nanoarchaeota archaeon]|nr:hypothetical protein [Nanoarchaeota archaeon]
MTNRWHLVLWNPRFLMSQSSREAIEGGGTNCNRLKYFLIQYGEGRCENKILEDIFRNVFEGLYYNKKRKNSRAIALEIADLLNDLSNRSLSDRKYLSGLFYSMSNYMCVFEPCSRNCSLELVD